MAQQGMKFETEKLCCSICLDLMKEPVTIPCGHSYCGSCIKNFWDEEEQKGVHSCPQCRQTFNPRPVLVRNTVLADLMDEKKKSGVQAAPEGQSSSDPGHVDCDFCTEKKQKAVKSCLQCLVSYCEQHLQPHFGVAALKTHKLVDPSRRLQERICSHHNELMKIFCCTDQSCICYLCSMDEHKDHKTVSAAAEIKEKQKELRAGQEKVQQRIQQKAKDVKMLKSHLEVIDQSADEAVGVLEKIFADAKQQIRSRQKAEVTSVNKLQEKLEQEIEDLRKEEAELEQLSHTEDHIQFLLRYNSLSRLRQDIDLTSVRIHPLSFRDDATATVSAFKDKLQNVLGEERITVPPGEAGVEDLLPEVEPETRQEFLKYVRPFTLDPNTAHKCIRMTIYADTTEIEHSETQSERGVHPDRFTSWPQVLFREHLTGRCYWELELTMTSCKSDAFIAVAYKDILRNGAESSFGSNDKSWMLHCYDEGYEFRHNGIRTPVSGPQSSRIGVFLDHSAGVLSFYSLSDDTNDDELWCPTMTLLHRVQTTFTRPLCHGLALYNECSAEFCEVY